MKNSSPKHIILVHGTCHGAWSWYKIIPLLKFAGYQVTVFDLAASGRDERKISEVLTFRDYSQPLLDIMRLIPEDEKVMLVGHSLGGLNIALAMEEFPERISVAVFLSAFIPDINLPPSHAIDQFAQEGWVSSLDTEFKSYDDEEKRPSTMFFGPDFMQLKLYQLSSQEDMALGMSLIRESSLFLEDLRCQEPFSKSRYGTVDSVYIICNQDLGMPAEYQHYMIKNNNLVKEVKIIETADHMGMLSAPQELAQCLMEIATKYF